MITGTDCDIDGKTDIMDLDAFKKMMSDLGGDDE
jgi:hypothetical protein